jgi:hypothetical protein
MPRANLAAMAIHGPDPLDGGRIDVASVVNQKAANYFAVVRHAGYASWSRSAGHEPYQR